MSPKCWTSVSLNTPSMRLLGRTLKWAPPGRVTPGSPQAPTFALLPAEGVFVPGREAGALETPMCRGRKDVWFTVTLELGNTSTSMDWYLNDQGSVTLTWVFVLAVLTCHCHCCHVPIPTCPPAGSGPAFVLGAVSRAVALGQRVWE